MFVAQLAGWFRDEETWPRDLGFDVFCRWFDFQHHSMLVDLFIGIGGSIPWVCQDWANTKAAYRFFSNGKVVVQFDFHRRKRMR
jgi:hypothetical protein